MIQMTSAVSQDAARIDLTINGIEEITGNLAVAVFDSKETFDARIDPVATAMLPVSASSASVSVDLPGPGTYAVIVYQDLNLNGQIDMTRIGIPTEPYGFSNNARSAFGPPGFRKTRLDVAAATITHEISLR